MYLPCIETHPWLSIGLLRRNGVLPGVPTKITRSILSEDYVVDYNSSKSQLIIRRINFEERSWLITVIQKQTGAVDQFYFVCPITRLATTKIHLIGERWGTRIAFPGVLSRTPSKQHRQAERVEEAADRLLGRNGYPKAKGHNRKKWLDTLQLALFVGSRRHEFDDLAWESPKPSSDRFLAIQRAMPNSTRAAVAAGRRLPRPEASQRVLQSQVSESSTWPVLGTEAALEVLEDKPNLDIRELSKAGLLAEPVAGQTLVWKTLLQDGLASATIILDLRDGSDKVVVLPTGPYAAAVLPHIIRLDRTPNRRRYYLVCPRSGARSDALYLRSGIFGAAKASRLVHRSQRGREFGP